MKTQSNRGMSDRVFFRAIGLHYRPKWKQVVIDIVALAFGILFATVTAFGVVASIFLLIFYGL
jgi:hypothetical protein